MILFETSFFINGVLTVNLFCLFVFIEFNDPSTYVFKGYADKSILIVFDVFVNGDEKVNVFCFVFKLLIVAYVEDAVDDDK